MLPSQDGASRRPPSLCWQARRDRRGSGTGTLSRGLVGRVSGRVSSVADLSRGMRCGLDRRGGGWMMTGSLPGRQGGWDEKEGKGACQ